MKKKVFCENCFYYKEYSWRDYPFDECRHPSNKKTVSTYKEKEVVDRWDPEEKNKKNDCILFSVKRKESLGDKFTRMFK